MHKLILFILVVAGWVEPAFTQDARIRVKTAWDYWRGASSVGQATMIVHRADWERSMSLKSWTKGSKNSLVRFSAPPKDAGNASLTLDQEMWSFAPKLNRIIKIPPSMMVQSWMGSDFSYNDISKGDDIIDRYDHQIVSSGEIDHHKFDLIQSIPHEASPVVWGKEMLKIRDDNIILEHEFYDQDMNLVKKLSVREIRMIGGKLYPTRIRMEKVSGEEKGEWTEVIQDEIEFNRDLPDSLFTTSNLQNPRE